MCIEEGLKAQIVPIHTSISHGYRQHNGLRQNTLLTKNKFAFFSPHKFSKRKCTMSMVWGDERMCTYLILVEIGLFHFSQGVFQVAKHEFLNLVVVCGPYFLESHINTDVLQCATREIHQMNQFNVPESLPSESRGENSWSLQGRFSDLAYQWI